MGEAACATGSPMASCVGYPDPDYISPTTYSAPGCFKGVKVDIDSYARGPLPTTVVSWNDSVPTNKADCEKLWLGAYVYQWDGSQYVVQDIKTSRGTWGNVFSPNTCFGPGVAFYTDVMPTLESYRITASARTDATGGAPTRKLRISTFPAPE
ncbi:hypothetical protein ACMHYB_35880 [Sorangium sp. So ce1128]